jgi:hypothetical protein
LDEWNGEGTLFAGGFIEDARDNGTLSMNITKYSMYELNGTTSGEDGYVEIQYEEAYIGTTDAEIFVRYEGNWTLTYHDVNNGTVTVTDTGWRIITIEDTKWYLTAFCKKNDNSTDELALRMSLEDPESPSGWFVWTVWSSTYKPYGEVSLKMIF